MLSKLEYLTDIALWPGTTTIDPHGWLRNFTNEEKAFAFNLLNVFVYYNDRLIDAMFYRAFQQYGAILAAGTESYTDATDRWRSFLGSACITYIQGNPPSPTDSGFIFARRANKVLGIRDEQILMPDDAIREALADPSRIVVLVDDFVGSGGQVTETWFRDYKSPTGTTHSFSKTASMGSTIVYLPLVATKHGMDSIAASCPDLTVHPVHTMDSQYSLLADESILWPDDLKANATEFLLEASRRAGIVDHYAENWQGFHGLALALAFSHGVPDATLPLFYWQRPGWTPLIRDKGSI